MVVKDGVDPLASGQACLDPIQDQDQVVMLVALHAAAPHGASTTLKAANRVVFPTSHHE
ncbi:hypothetical protein ACD578_27755 (plasmid) [Microvirga sp. RSM25]|uniref:hypothetical protein n=1 Tax=Microvirga sp. RSM25 TaxID=3273802 RepID=UPI0038512E8B